MAHAAAPPPAQGQLPQSWAQPRRTDGNGCSAVLFARSRPRSAMGAFSLVRNLVPGIGTQRTLPTRPKSWAQPHRMDGSGCRVVLAGGSGAVGARSASRGTVLVGGCCLAVVLLGVGVAWWCPMFIVAVVVVPSVLFLGRLLYLFARLKLWVSCCYTLHACVHVSIYSVGLI